MLLGWLALLFFWLIIWPCHGDKAEALVAV